MRLAPEAAKQRVVDLLITSSKQVRIIQDIGADTAEYGANVAKMFNF